MREVITTANLIVGSDGATTAGGSSIGLSTAQDRSRFNNLRGKSDLILIGGNTARREPYKRTPIPLYILTHGKVRLQPKNQLVKQFMMPVADLIAEIASNFPPIDSKLPINLLVEAGPKLLLQMVEQGLIDNLYLTTNLEKDGENKIAVDKLTGSFNLISSEKIDSCQFEYYKRLA
jgi:riboflavin biosynthesis pyrimidine reductase